MRNLLKQSDIYIMGEFLFTLPFILSCVVFVSYVVNEIYDDIEEVRKLEREKFYRDLFKCDLEL